MYVCIEHEIYDRSEPQLVKKTQKKTHCHSVDKFTLILETGIKKVFTHTQLSLSSNNLVHLFSILAFIQLGYSLFNFYLIKYSETLYNDNIFS